MLDSGGLDGEDFPLESIPMLEIARWSTRYNSKLEFRTSSSVRTLECGLQSLAPILYWYENFES